MVQPLQPLQQELLDQHPDEAHRQGHQHQGHPVVDAGVIQQHPGEERPHHVQGTMGEVDDVEHAEDHGQAQRQQRIEGSVDQAQHELPHEGLDRHAVWCEVQAGLTS